ncbi:signal recognition particle-docking protein FtsY [Puniceicoccales bacterium CK1056]|uniref:Signal recognition particle receptor FtsY n=1 Tax=Oceanipulchritudo coccoides TaxID=2706888 RepID=A0A6B2LZB7_9BACT|nr:signal recognition particle-docking protein FtsY [Oceanipulchritudo coccoides]NDV60835.1 signal recognition particle-docking protein FtsY [Oceanipulchritudo coccoides]
MKSFFSKFKEGLKKSTPTFYKAFGKVGGLFSGKTIDADTLDELEEALYMADFGVETTEEILGAIREAYRENKELRGQEAAQIGTHVLESVLEGSEGRIEPGAHKPEVIALIGVNGSGKTTTTAKLAHLFKEDGLKPLVGACDTFRAAANEQVRTWCERLDVELVASQHGADSAAVAYDAYAAAKSRGADVLILDTAGRLHNKANLMKELQKIRRVLQKHDEAAPHHSWLVIDGSIGSNSIEQARVFHEAFGLTGIIVTKLDGTSRGGALVGIYRELKLPIYFVGLGEQPEDFQPFSIHHYTHALFGVED